MIWVWILVVLAVLIIFGGYLSMTAGRLDRLHHRLDTALAALDAQLLRRSATVLDAASSGLFDPATSLVIADAAVVVREAKGDPHERESDESDLSGVLAAALADRDEIDEIADSGPVGAELVADLAGAVHRTAIARRFYNDAVRATRAVRRQRLVRWFRLAGHTDWPQTVEMDDSIPNGLENR